MGPVSSDGADAEGWGWGFGDIRAVLMMWVC